MALSMVYVAPTEFAIDPRQEGPCSVFPAVPYSPSS